MDIAQELVKLCPHLPYNVPADNEVATPNQRYTDWLGGAQAMAKLMSAQLQEHLTLLKRVMDKEG